MHAAEHLAVTTPFLGYSLFSGSLEAMPFSEKLLIATINQYSFCLARRDPVFKNILQHVDILLPDGIAITLSARFLSGSRIPKLAGSDAHQGLLERLNREKGSCFYVGSTETTLLRIKNRLAREFPEVRAGFYAPPFSSVFSEQESKAMIDAVNAFHPDVLFLGMTAPKQEKWAFRYRSEVNARIICCIGAVFDFYAGTTPRPGKLWISLGLEWLGRLLQEPRRLWKRYLYYGPIFIACMITEKWKTLF